MIRRLFRGLFGRSSEPLDVLPVAALPLEVVRSLFQRPTKRITHGKKHRTKAERARRARRRLRRLRTRFQRPKPRHTSKLARRVQRTVRVSAPASTRPRPNSRKKRRARWLVELEAARLWASA